MFLQQIHVSSLEAMCKTTPFTAILKLVLKCKAKKNSNKIKMNETYFQRFACDWHTDSAGAVQQRTAMFGVRGRFSLGRNLGLPSSHR